MRGDNVMGKSFYVKSAISAACGLVIGLVIGKRSIANGVSKEKIRNLGIAGLVVFGGLAVSGIHDLRKKL